MQGNCQTQVDELHTHEFNELVTSINIGLSVDCELSKVDY